MPTQDTKQNKWEERIWIFIAYKEEGLPFFSKLFTDHAEMKVFSAEHSDKNKSLCKDYSSTYFELTDKDLLSQKDTERNAELRREIESLVNEIGKGAYSRDKLEHANNTIEYAKEIGQAILSILDNRTSHE